MTGAAGQHSAAALKEEWLTPPGIIEALGPFDLDPCAAKDQPWPTAKKQLTIFDDGLSQKWRGYVWCNPPYGKQTHKWLSRLADHKNGIALIFARTDTKMFHEQVWQKATALHFFQGRLHFHHANGTVANMNCGAPSVLVAYGDKAAVKLFKSKLEGQFVRLRQGR